MTVDKLRGKISEASRHQGSRYWLYEGRLLCDMYMLAEGLSSSEEKKSIASLSKAKTRHEVDKILDAAQAKGWSETVHGAALAASKRIVDAHFAAQRKAALGSPGIPLKTWRGTR